LDKKYLLHCATYLIESITYYIGDALYEQKYIEFKVDEYSNQQKIVSILNLNHNPKDFDFPHDYFIDINIDIINKFNTLRKKVAVIRHNLAHINIIQNLKSDINELEELINKNILYSFDKTLSKKELTIKYQLEQLEKKANNLQIKNRNKNSVKITTIFNKFKNNELEKLANFDTYKLENFCKNNKNLYNKLEEAKFNRNLLSKTPLKIDKGAS
jgi:hypothetical protein